MGEYEMISVIDYGAGNIQSVIKAFHHIGCDVQVTADREVIKASDAAILPGVGAFGDSMNCLKNAGLVQPVLDFIESGKPFLGICLGLQLLFEGSEESPGVRGLGVLEGKILRIPADRGLKVPHIGWNSLELRSQSGLFAGLEEDPYVYFVHSYYLKAESEDIVTAAAWYGTRIHVSVEKENVFGCQFHPEKSSSTGLQILKNFVTLREE